MTSRSPPAWGFGFSSRPAAAGGGQRAPAAVVLQAPSYPPRARRRRRALPRLSRRSPTGRPALGKPEHTYDGRPVVASSLALIHYCMHFFGRKSSKHSLFSNSFTSSELSNGCSLCSNTRTTGCGYFGKGGGGGGRDTSLRPLRAPACRAPPGLSVPGCPQPRFPGRLSTELLHQQHGSFPNARPRWPKEPPRSTPKPAGAGDAVKARRLCSVAVTRAGVRRSPEDLPSCHGEGLPPQTRDERGGLRSPHALCAQAGLASAAGALAVRTRPRPRARRPHFHPDLPDDASVQLNWY